MTQLTQVQREPGVVVNLKGGLGNQIFQSISGWLVAQIRQRPYYAVQAQVNQHVTQNQDQNDTIFKQFGPGIKQTVQEMLKEGQLNSYHFFDQGGFDVWNPMTVPAPTVMEGQFQQYPALEPFEPAIRTLLWKGLSEQSITDPQWNTIDWSNAAFMHIRRGDQCKLSHIHTLQPETQYLQCQEHLKQLDGEPKHLLLFSDDPAQIEKETQLMKLPGAILVQTDHEMEALHLMAKCEKAAICANSTFSWWGAFLGAHAKRNPVFVPSAWISSLHVQPISLHPKEWIVL